MAPWLPRPSGSRPTSPRCSMPRTHPPLPARRPRLTRRGCMYVAVLGAAMLITVLGLSGLLAARIEARSSFAQADIAEARRNAAAALEVGRYVIASQSGWKSRGTGDWFTHLDLGKGYAALNVADPVDGDLSAG